MVAPKLLCRKPSYRESTKPARVERARPATLASSACSQTLAPPAAHSQTSLPALENSIVRREPILFLLTGVMVLRANAPVQLLQHVERQTRFILDQASFQKLLDEARNRLLRTRPSRGGSSATSSVDTLRQNLQCAVHRQPSCRAGDC